MPLVAFELCAKNSETPLPPLLSPSLLPLPKVRLDHPRFSLLWRTQTGPKKFTSSCLFEYGERTVHLKKPLSRLTHHTLAKFIGWNARTGRYIRVVHATLYSSEFFRWDRTTQWLIDWHNRERSLQCWTLTPEIQCNFMTEKSKKTAGKAFWSEIHDFHREGI